MYEFVKHSIPNHHLILPQIYLSYIEYQTSHEY